jgi:hypothetical protein
MGQGSPDQTRLEGERTGKLLADLGVNLNFAPVADVDVNPDSPVIGRLERSFSADPDMVALHAHAFCQGLLSQGVLPCLKHFPGHGSATEDSHLGLTDISKTWTPAELRPYEMLIPLKASPLIMTGHLFLSPFDEEHPSTLSRNVLTGLLRQRLGFDGVIVSDDMQMRAITSHYGLEEAVVLAVEAGVDILVFGNNLDFDPEYRAQGHGHSGQGRGSGRLSAERIAASYQRIQAAKDSNSTPSWPGTAGVAMTSGADSSLRPRFPTGLEMKRTLKDLLAKATPLRSGDVLAGVAAATEEERVRAQMELAEVPLTRFLEEHVIPYEEDEVTRLIVDSHDPEAFAPVRSFSVGELRDWLLTDEADGAVLSRLAFGLTPEMVAAVSKLMRLQDLVLVASKCRVVTRFRNTIGLPGTFSVRLQPNHPTDDLKGIAASTLDGLCYGCGDAVIGVNPATDNLDNICRISEMLDGLISRYAIPTQSCVLTHVTTTMEAIKRGAPVDLCFQSIAGTQAANASFGVTLSLLQEALEATRSLGAALWATTSCISRPARAARFRPERITEWTSRPWRPGPTPWPENSSRCWSTRWSGSSARNIC